MTEQFEILLTKNVKNYLNVNHFTGAMNGNAKCAYYGFSPYSADPNEWDGIYHNDPTYLHNHYEYVMNTMTGKWAKS